MSLKKGQLEVSTTVISSEDADSTVAISSRVSGNAPSPVKEVADNFTSEQKFYILKRLNYDTLVSFDPLPLSASYLIDRIERLELGEAENILKNFVLDHAGDVNIKWNDFEFVEKLLASRPESTRSSHINEVSAAQGEKVRWEKERGDSAVGNQEIFDWELQVRTEAGIIQFHSPYPEVRAVTEPFDDAELPCETIRVYIIGVIWSAIGAFINQFFTQRQPNISLGPTVVQIFLYPSGRFLAWALPKRKIKIWKWSIDLNPGPWNHKEQSLATIFYSVSGPSITSVVIPVMKMDMFYGVKWASSAYQIMLMLSTQFMGFGFAGIMRKFAVYPTRALWPTLLSVLALNKALLQKEAKENINGWKISSYNFFLVVFIASFLYFWLPNYVFGALSTFNWMTWISPTCKALAVVTGSIGGLGLNPVSTFDWNIINVTSPLLIPFYAQLNQYTGTFLAFFCVLGVWYSNYKWTGYLPINSFDLFNNKGESYEVTNILTDDKLIDHAKFASYGTPFYSAGNLVSYGAIFALYPFTILYICLAHGKHIKFALSGLYAGLTNFRRSTYEGYNDAYCESMRKYKEVPEWCFLVVLAVSIVLSIVCVKLYPMNTPVWTIFFALGLSFVLLVPITLIGSITGISLGLNVLVQLIVGYLLPGNGIALMFVQTFGANIDGQAQNYVTDQKMGHYLRVPPRALFRTQILSTFMTSMISLAVMNFLVDNIDDYCMPGQAQKFTCPSAKLMYSMSVFWGTIGSKTVFSSMYPILKWCFFIGFLLAPAMFFVKKYFCKIKTIKYFEPVLVIGGMTIYGAYNLSYYTPGLITSYFFMMRIRNKYSSWFQKYNFVLSGALSAGVAFSSIIIFFAVQYNSKPITWWGNTISFMGVDARGLSNLDPATAPDGYFGPRIVLDR